MGVQKILNSISLLNNDQLNNLLAKLFEKKIVTLDKARTAYNNAMVIKKGGDALDTFRESCSNPDLSGENVPVRLLSDLFFLRVVDVDKCMSLDYKNKTRRLSTYGELSFLLRYTFPFLVNANGDNGKVIKEGLKIFAVSNEIIKSFAQNILSKSMFYKMKNMFMKFVISHGVCYSWHIEDKADEFDEGRRYVSITIMNDGETYKFHQVYNDIKSALNFDCVDSEPVPYKRDSLLDATLLDDDTVAENLSLVKLYYYKFLYREP